jgi:hypothetical protein
VAPALDRIPCDRRFEAGAIDQVTADEADLVAVEHTFHQILSYEGTNQANSEQSPGDPAPQRLDFPTD